MSQHVGGSEQQRAMGRQEWAMLLALSVLWGSSFFFFKVLVAALPPFTVVLGRVGIAAVILSLVLVLRREPMHRRLPWREFLIMGLLNNVIPFSLIVWGKMRVTSGVASILNATTPVFAVLAAHFLTRGERLSWLRASGVACGVAGVIVLVGPDALRGIGSENLPGEAACLLAAVSYAIAGIYGRRLRGLPPMQIATGQVTGAAIIMLPLAAIFDQFWRLPAPPLAIWEALAGISVLCTVCAYVLYFRILATAGPTNLLLVTFLLPGSGLLLGHLVLGEAVAARAVFGMVVIGAGLALIDGRLPAWFARRAVYE